MLSFGMQPVQEFGFVLDESIWVCAARNHGEGTGLTCTKECFQGAVE